MELIHCSPKKNDHLAWRIIDGEAFIVHPANGMIYPLNDVATRIWELMDGRRTAKEIIDTLHGEFDAPQPVIQDDLLSFLESSLKADLINIEQK
jgi:hypothetical protein